MRTTKRADGWWIVDLPPYRVGDETFTDYGPYKTRDEADADLAGLTRFYRDHPEYAGGHGAHAGPSARAGGRHAQPGGAAAADNAVDATDPIRGRTMTDRFPVCFRLDCDNPAQPGRWFCRQCNDVIRQAAARDAAQEPANDYEAEAALRKRGIIDPMQERLATVSQRTIAEPVDGFRATMEASGRDAKHIGATVGYIEQMAQAAGIKAVGTSRPTPRWLNARHVRQRSRGPDSDRDGRGAGYRGGICGGSWTAKPGKGAAGESPQAAAKG